MYHGQVEVPTTVQVTGLPLRRQQEGTEGVGTACTDPQCIHRTSIRHLRYNTTLFPLLHLNNPRARLHDIGILGRCLSSALAGRSNALLDFGDIHFVFVVVFKRLVDLARRVEALWPSRRLMCRPVPTPTRRSITQVFPRREYQEPSLAPAWSGIRHYVDGVVGKAPWAGSPVCY